jgi:ADP-heptose:LPS heptosyltransferase
MWRMNVASMRRIDRWVGVPVCALLTLMRRVDDLLLRRRPTTTPGKIAAIKLAEQGATVLAYPALVDARDRVGADNLYFVVFAQNRFIVDLLDIVPTDNVISIRTGNPLLTFIETLGAVWRMRREGIEATIDCEFFARSSAILSYLSGARTRVGFHAYFGEASYRGDLMTHRLSFNPFLHASQIFHLLVEAIGCPPERLPACDLEPPDDLALPQITPAEQDLAAVEGLLRDTLGVDTIPPLVLLNANCGDLLPLRRWAPERYVELARRLLDRFPELAIVFTGAPDEAAEATVLVDEIASGRCVNLAGRTSLPQLFALYCLAELMVTNDSGPGHYSTVTPIDVISLFGPETPAVFGPRTPRSHVLWSGIACSPCVNAFNDRQSACTDNVCMARVSVEEVFELACRVYEARERATE